ncbi:hypothetical protein RN001_002818 [Aquatica leii]|uniref:Tyr recombinase domain-containing protein n=1 Tax=Aquatica leii TaxID=1421715 RepID=A0AAN7SKD6_9COLE|nr:hypothetical protein RN001_002818 [Aquatica leii]
MLRTCLNLNKNVDISKYHKLQAFLKRNSTGYQPKKSKILDDSQINKFLNEANDQCYLGIKVILIMGYSGAMRRDELTQMVIDDIQFKEDSIHVQIPKTKNNVSRLFVITKQTWISIIQKYVALRPFNVSSKRFFLTYRNGRCITSPIGINKIGQVPRVIAQFLQLSNPSLYTGHCFRRSSATHLADCGGDLLTIKRHGGWKSSAVAEGYVETSLLNKVAVSNLLSSNSTVTGPHTSATATVTSTSSKVSMNENLQHTVVNETIPGICINAKDNVTINLKFNNCTFNTKN